MRQDLPFENYLRRRRYLQIDGLTFHQWNRRSLQSARDFDFIDVWRKLDAAYDRDHRLPADCNRHGHGPIHRFVFLVHLTNMLLQRKETAERVSIVDHQTIHAPVNPRAVRVLGDHGVPRANIAPAITAVNQRDRKFKNIDIVT